MGSLMAGWSSHALPPQRHTLSIAVCNLRFMRNRSLTKEDVEAFWRQQTKPPAPEDNVNGGTTVLTSPLSRPSTLSYARSSPPVMTGSVDGDGRWTRSSWAFLNEPPPQQRRERGVGQGAAAAV
ncbi:hypothetical protein VPH35_068686 [Triticum aestivum]